MEWFPSTFSTLLASHHASEVASVLDRDFHSYVQMMGFLQATDDVAKACRFHNSDFLDHEGKRILDPVSTDKNKSTSYQDRAADPEPFWAMGESACSFLVLWHPKQPHHLETPGTRNSDELSTSQPQQKDGRYRGVRWFHRPFRGQIGCLLPSGSCALCFERRSLRDGSGGCCG